MCESAKNPQRDKNQKLNFLLKRYKKDQNFTLFLDSEKVNSAFFLENQKVKKSQDGKVYVKNAVLREQRDANPHAGV